MQVKVIIMAKKLCGVRRPLGGAWSELKCDKYTVQIKHFEKPSKYGIKKGRISKLGIFESEKYPSTLMRKQHVSFDRGWDKRVTKKTPAKVKQVYKEIIKKYN